MIGGRQAKILVIDDDPNLLRMMGILLERANYDYHDASNGLEGLRKAVEIRPDLIILDMAMPFLKGAEVCRRLRAEEQTAQVPILIMSSLDSLDDKLSGFEAGADDYVTKPVNPKELLARINALLVRAKFGRVQIARIVAVMGAKGGVGTTTVALNLAIALTQRDKSVTLAEFHPYQSTVCYQANTPAGLSLADLLTLDPENIDRTVIENHLVRHSTGLSLLLAATKPETVPFTAAHTDAIVPTLQQDTDVVILDLATATGDAVRRALELADQILLVTEPELLSVICARQRLELLRNWHMMERVDAVSVGRVPSGVLMTRMEVENEMALRAGATVGRGHWEKRQTSDLGASNRGVVSMIAPAPELLQESVRAGVPLMLFEPSSRPARALSDLAEWVLEMLGEPFGDPI